MKVNPLHAQLWNCGLTADECQKCEAAGFNLAALVTFLVQHGPEAIALFKQLLAIINPPTPTPPAPAQ